MHHPSKQVGDIPEGAVPLTEPEPYEVIQFPKAPSSDATVGSVVSFIATFTLPK